MWLRTGPDRFNETMVIQTFLINVNYDSSSMRQRIWVMVTFWPVQVFKKSDVKTEHTYSLKDISQLKYVKTIKLKKNRFNENLWILWTRFFLSVTIF